MCSEPELGPGLMKWLALLGNVGLWREDQPTGVIAISLAHEPDFISLRPQPRSPTRKALAFSASCQRGDEVSGQALAIRRMPGVWFGIREHMRLAFLPFS